MSNSVQTTPSSIEPEEQNFAVHKETPAQSVESISSKPSETLEEPSKEETSATGVAGAVSDREVSQETSSLSRTVNDVVTDSRSVGSHSTAEAEPGTSEAPEENEQDLEDRRWVLSLRGLSWNATVEDVYDFLRQSHCIKVIHMIGGGTNGKSSGEAMVEFTTQDSYIKGLECNMKTCNGRPIEVKRGSDKKLDRSLGRIPLSKVPTNPMSYVIRMRGVPYEATIEDIEEFFGELKPQAIHIPRDNYGRPSGDAFVEFEKHEDGYQATYRHRECLGHRYIEIFQSTIKELCIAMGVSMKIKVLPIRLTRRMDGVQVYAEFATVDDVTNVMKLQHRYIGHRYVELFPCDTAEVEMATGKKFDPIPVNKQIPSILTPSAVPPPNYVLDQQPQLAFYAGMQAFQSPPSPAQMQQFVQPPTFVQQIPHSATTTPSPVSMSSQVSKSPKLYHPVGIDGMQGYTHVRM